MPGPMPEKKRHFVVTGLRVAGWLTVLIGAFQIIDTFHLDTFTGVAIGILIICGSTIFFGLAAILRHLQN